MSCRCDYIIRYLWVKSDQVSSSLAAFGGNSEAACLQKCQQFEND